MFVPFLFLLLSASVTSAAPGCYNSCQVYGGFNGTQGPAGPVGPPGPPGETDVVILREQYLSGMAGASCRTTGAFTIPRRLNNGGVLPSWLTLDGDTGVFRLAGNATYALVASGSAQAVGVNQVRLLNATTGANVCSGVVVGAAGVFDASTATFDCLVPAASESELQLHHWASGGNTGCAFGSAMRVSGEVEVYATLRITRLRGGAVAMVTQPPTTPIVAPWVSANPYNPLTSVVASVTVAAVQGWLFLGDSGFGIHFHGGSSYIAQRTRIYFPVGGAYWCAASVHASINAAGSTNMDAWMRINGVDVPESANSATLSVANDVKLMSTGFVAQLAPGDYVEIAYRMSTLAGRMLHIATGTNPTRPAGWAVVLNMARMPTGAAWISRRDTSAVQTGSTTLRTLITFNTLGGVSAASPGFTVASATTTNYGSSGPSTLPRVAYVAVFGVQATGATGQMDMWMRANAAPGNAWSNTRWTLITTTDYKLTTAWVMFDQLAGSGAALEIAWLPSTTAIELRSLAAGTNPVRPGSPCATLDVQRLEPGVPYYQAYETTQQTTASTTVANLVTFGTQQFNLGVTRTSSTRTTIDSAGTYALAVTLHVTSSATTSTFDTWLRVNGVDVAGSGGQAKTLTAGDIRAMVRTYTLRLAAGDYLEVLWRADSTSGVLFAAAADGTRTAGTPSARLLLYRVSTEAP